MKGLRAALAATPVVLYAVTPIQAQVVRGLVSDSVTSQALEGVVVELLSPSGRSHARVPTGATGEFALTAPAAGVYMLRTQRQGYRRWVSHQFRLESDTSARLQLVPAGPPVSAAVVISTRNQEYLEQVGFYQRRNSTAGEFMDPERVARVAARVRLTSEVLDDAPGVTVMTGGGTWGYQIPQVVRHGGCGPGETDGKPRVYLDGKMMNNGYEWFDLVHVKPADLLAIEIYDMEIPLQYGGTDAVCGVVVIWTRR